MAWENCCWPLVRFPLGFLGCVPNLGVLGRGGSEILQLGWGPQLLGDLGDDNIDNQIQPDQPDLSRYFYFTWVGDGGRFIRTKDPFIKRNGPGYTVRRGRWKGMVPHCRDQDRAKPSLRDRMRLFDLVEDPLETKDVSSSNPEIVQDLKKLVVSQNLSCICYQCFWPFHKAHHGRGLRKQMLCSL